MQPPENAITAILGVLLAAAAAYAAGRLHQWYRHALERHDSWRDGYDQASKSLFRYAVTQLGGRRASASKPTGKATVTPLMAVPPVPAETSPVARRNNVERFERSTVRLLRQPRHADTGDEPTTIIHRAS